MKKISDFEGKEHLDQFLVKKHVDAVINGTFSKVPLLHKIRTDREGNNAMDTHSNLYKIREDDDLIPVSG